MGGDPEAEDIGAFKVERTVKGRQERMVLIVVYMTVEGQARTRTDNEKKLGEIGRVMGKFQGEEIIIMGDFNSHIGILGEGVNTNGNMLLDFMEEKQLENLNLTMAEGRVTWEQRGTKSAIDFILVNEEARRKVKGMMVGEEGVMDLGSDHNALLLTYGGIRVISLRMG